MAHNNGSVKRQNGAVRPYYYALGWDGDFHAYTREEWGMGGSLPNGGNTVIRSWVFQLGVAVIMVPAFLTSLIVLLVGIVSSDFIVMLISIVCASLFFTGIFVGFSAFKTEFKAKRFRKAKGLPKPRTSVSDEVARQHFEEYPEYGIASTKENFPDAYWR